MTWSWGVLIRYRRPLRRPIWRRPSQRAAIWPGRPLDFAEITRRQQLGDNFRASGTCQAISAIVARSCHWCGSLHTNNKRSSHFSRPDNTCSHVLPKVAGAGPAKVVESINGQMPTSYSWSYTNISSYVCSCRQNATARSYPAATVLLVREFRPGIQQSTVARCT